MARSACTECGSSVEWITPDEAETRGLDLTTAFAFLGVQPSDEIWACPRCGNFGVMGPTSATF